MRKEMKMKKSLTAVLFAIVLCLLFAGCAVPNAVDTNNSGFAGQFELAKIDASIVSANTRFAFEIFRKLNREEPKENIFISPFSISTALAMTYNGAEGKTKQQMAEVLGYKNAELSLVNVTMQNLIVYLNQVDSKVSLDIGNSIWVREREKIQEEFLLNTEKHFNAFAQMLDFSKADSADRINQWISKATHKKINQMIEPPIPPDVVMYLISAIYFKGEWTHQFDPKKTFDGKFFKEDGSKQDVKIMNRKGKVEFAEGADYKAVRLPYGSGKTSMYCILPDEKMKINDFIANLDAEKWGRIFRAPVETDDVMLGIPRLKMEYGIKLLNDTLISLGMTEAFGINADFSGIREDIYISKVLHKAVIEVNEEGSEAAGVTVVEKKEVAAFNDEPQYFIANRPFLFLIVDDETGTILFMGKMQDTTS